MVVLVCDDIFKVMVLCEDLVFICGDGFVNILKGIKNWMLFVNWIVGVVNVLMIVDVVLCGLVFKVEDVNVGMVFCGWIMWVVIKNFLVFLCDLNGGNYLYLFIQQNGMLFGYLIKIMFQILMNLGVGGNEIEVYFGDFDEVFIGDVMMLEFEILFQVVYVDFNGDMQFVFQQDLMLFCVIFEYDLVLCYDEVLFGLIGVGWIF